MLLFNGVAHEVSPEGFLVVEPLRRRRMLRWSEITEVYFDAGRSWWRIRTARDSFWVFQALSGLGAFFGFLLALWGTDLFLSLAPASIQVLIVATWVSVGLSAFPGGISRAASF